MKTNATTSKKRELQGVLLALLGAICWGFSATCFSLLTMRANVEVLYLADLRVLGLGIVLL